MGQTARTKFTLGHDHITLEPNSAKLSKVFFGNTVLTHIPAVLAVATSLNQSLGKHGWSPHRAAVIVAIATLPAPVRSRYYVGIYHIPLA